MGSDSEEKVLVVDDDESTTPPCLAIQEDDTEQSVNIRVAVQGRVLLGT